MFLALRFVVFQCLDSPGKPEPAEARGKTKTRRRSYLLLSLLAVIVAVVILWLLCRLFGFFPTVIVSDSMSPAIVRGDVVVLREVSADEVSEGDVIRYSYPGGNRIHRVIEVLEQDGSRVFITQGDANNIRDAQPVHPDQIKGRVEFRIPKIGWVNIGIKNLIGKVF